MNLLYNVGLDTHNSIYERRSLRVNSYIDVNKQYSFNSFEYTSYKRFNRDLKRILKKFDVSEMNITKLTKLFQDDLASFDISLNIMGHDRAYNDLISINEVEELALTKGDLEILSNNNYLYEYEFKDMEIVEIKKFLRKELLKRKKNKESIKKIVNKFSRSKLRPYVMSMNSKFDAQYVMTSNGIVPEDTNLTKDELNEIYNMIKQMIAKYANDIFFASYWKTLNQKVLERYK